ncbi:DNA repair photolyase [Gracilibacillus ureilyticus]|uniref:DNA repair photolyase n=1 Tax=Gracilibacillus ureilyticus TaxID=531814 RepID=A0A1H9RSU1_9BACI|nr:radical SAM protein [Gracilibacillus ureilyticus]SER75707.1 DNA repair photolyase [Gracilibacillus ureilyticus]
MSNKNITYKTPKKILTPTSGFLNDYSHTLNPYVGCVFGCSYCYVRQSPVGLFRREEWGTWVDVKQEVKEKIMKEISNLRKRNKQVTIFMSSSTDPYQPIEYRERVTRSLLEGMVEVPPDFLFVQTRSPLVTRDIDLFDKLKPKLRISVTVETDDDEVRKRFSPHAPPIPVRLKAVRQLKERELPVQLAIAPVLPFTSKFPAIIAETVDRVVIDDYFTGDGSNGKRTERLQIRELYSQGELSDWFSRETHQLAVKKLKETFPEEKILVSQEGFSPN